MKNFVKMFLSSGKKLPRTVKKLISPVSFAFDFEDSLKGDVWSNKFEESAPCTTVYGLVHDFLNSCTLKDGKAITKDGKTAKVLFLGYDGMRADMARCIAERKNAFDCSENSVTYSGIKDVMKNGGLYLAYCGGETGTNTQQVTSTSAGWTAQFTGVWGVENGVDSNNDTKNMNHLTFLTECAKLGLSVSLNFDWSPFFDINLYPEVKCAMEHPEMKLTYCDTSKKKCVTAPSGSKVSAEFINFTAPKVTPDALLGDAVVRDYVLKRIEGGDDIVCGIYDGIDGAGHKFEFSPKCREYASAALLCDIYSHQVTEIIKEREKNLNEEWLIIFSNDHGGKGKGHGGQSLEERTVWIATNKSVSNKFFGKNYNGKTEMHE